MRFVYQHPAFSPLAPGGVTPLLSATHLFRSVIKNLKEAHRCVRLRGSKRAHVTHRPQQARARHASLAASARMSRIARSKRAHVTHRPQIRFKLA
jgi:hypothetical protein